MNKLLSLILLLSLSLAFYSCGSDDDNDEPEKFVWGGDWNDPDDPNYKPEYEGKYNPIQGLWRSTKDRTRGLYFSEDFKQYYATFSATGNNYALGSGEKYKINDKAYTIDFFYKYRIEDDFLYISITSISSSGNWSRYIRVKE